MYKHPEETMFVGIYIDYFLVVGDTEEIKTFT